MYYQNFTTFSTNSTCPALLFFTQGQGLAMPQRLLLSLQLQQLCLILLLFFWYIVANVLRYTGWFFWSASISVPKWKPTSSQSRPFFNSNRIYCTSSRAWLLEGFLFGAEIWGDQLKKITLYLDLFQQISRMHCGSHPCVIKQRGDFPHQLWPGIVLE